MQSSYLDAIRKFEGFTQKAEWDYAQHTNGFGTKALYPGEVIDKAEADRRFSAEISSARAIVERHAADLDEGTKAALTSLTFNAGDKWTRSGLGEAVRSGDLDGARELFLQYNKAGGEALPGLVARRVAEAAWIGSGLGSGDVSSRAGSPPNTGGDAGFVAQALASPAAKASDPLLASQASAPTFETAQTSAKADGDEEDPFSIIRAAVSSFGSEAKMTQLLLAARFIKSESAEGENRQQQQGSV